VQRRKVLTIGEVNQAIKGALDQCFPYPMPLTGEVSNLTIHSSGHVYMTLKDKTSQIQATWFGQAKQARHLGLKNGTQIEGVGRIAVYPPKGSYQINLSSVQLSGKGAIHQEFELLKLKLRDQGLLDVQRKRPIPTIPKIVGIITSPTGAAIQDILQIVNRRFSGMHIRIYPGKVQGPRTAEFTIAGLKYFNKHQACDVILITRGGGSYEDLSGFNDEELAHAIANSDIPVISAIGHEPDVTIPDLVADFTAPTPSAAAELVCGKKSEILQQIESMKRQIHALIRLQLGEYQQRLHQISYAPILQEPKHILSIYMQKLDEITTQLRQQMLSILTAQKHQLSLINHKIHSQQLDSQLQQYKEKLDLLSTRQRHAIHRKLSQSQQHLTQLKSTITAYNPQHIVDRGYAILRNEQGTIVRKTTSLKKGQSLTASISDGSIDLTINSIKKDQTHA
jgi:exodeoxyribonuclease VII large subunit